MKGRRLEKKDIPFLESLQESQELGIPTPNHKIIDAIIEENGESLAYGIAKVYPEATLIVKPGLGKKIRAKILREALKIAIIFSKQAGFNLLYVVSRDEKFSQVLRKSYGFRSYPGELLVLDLEDKE